MLAQIHRLHSKGDRLPIEVARGLFFGGALVFGKVDGDYRAKVNGPSAEPIATLRKAKVTQLDSDGVMLVGMEHDADGTEYKQAWWCLLKQP